MAVRHRDALKAQRQNEKHRARNRNAKAALKAGLKSGRASAGDPKKVAETIKLIGRTGSAGIIHKRKASRLISRLAKLANKQKAAAK